MIIDWDIPFSVQTKGFFFAGYSGPPTRIAKSQNSINNTAHTNKILRNPYE